MRAPVNMLKLVFLLLCAFFSTTRGEEHEHDLPKDTAPLNVTIVKNNLLLLHQLYTKWERIPLVFRHYLCLAIREELKESRSCLKSPVGKTKLLELAAASRFNHRFPLDTLQKEWDLVRSIVNTHKLLQDPGVEEPVIVKPIGLSRPTPDWMLTPCGL